MQILYYRKKVFIEKLDNETFAKKEFFLKKDCYFMLYTMDHSQYSGVHLSPGPMLPFFGMPIQSWDVLP